MNSSKGNRVPKATQIVLVLMSMTSGATSNAWAGQESLLERPLFADHTAYRPGDLLTVVITESAAATASARTRADKRDRIAASVRFPSDEREDADISLGTEFNGGGQIQRSGKLLARLAVVVDDVDLNGNLIIRGEQDILVNNEPQRIALSGLVRRADISPDNTIASSRIANARIDFKGDGILARQQRPGLLGLIFRLFGLN